MLLFLSDILLLNLSVFAAFYFYDNSFLAIDKVGFIYLVIYSNLAWLFLVMVSAPYGLTKGWTVSKILKNQVAFLFIHLLVIASLVIFFHKNYSLFQIVFIYLLFTPLFFGYRLLIFYFKKLATGVIPNHNFLLLVDILTFFIGHFCVVSMPQQNFNTTVTLYSQAHTLILGFLLFCLSDSFRRLVVRAIIRF